ncbi:hypothetical protein A9Q93_06045 [Nonlabens dokdonensis]|uniref:Lipoprotein n=1 Tax=Nonlabens dokdonensis TaxID=328515 RepID=A0A1Z8B0B0_9FLAO|nr:hypothetical protein [Nonlabens dokdonensis]OUS16025.1 hypothetical protein A9Q93_06045 [Nonlabens dokdonensis]
MKKLILSILIVVAIIGCSSLKSSNDYKIEKGTITNDTIRIANDSLKYEVIIFEPGFNAWLATQPQQGYFSQSSMEITNNLRVNEYNLRVQNPSKYSIHLYPFRIDYDRRIDYGYEVNYLLHNYFLFFEQKYKQRLL